MPVRLTRGLLLAIVLIAFTLRVAAALVFKSPDITGYTESGVTAKNLVAGQGYTFDFFGTRREHPLQAFMPPVYPALIAMCLSYFGNPARALQLIQTLLSSLTCLLIYYTMAKLASNQAIGLLAALGVAVYPVHIIMSAYPLSLTLDLFALALIILAGIVLRDGLGMAKAALTGVLLGFAVLVRPTFAGLGAIVMVWLWVSLPGKRIKVVKAGVITAACMLLTISPWTWRNYRVLGRFVLVSTNGGFVFWNGNNPFTTGSGHEVYTALADQFRGVPHDLQQPDVVQMQPYPLPKTVEVQVSTIDEVELDQQLYQAGLAFIRDNPQRWAALAVSKLEGLWWFREGIGRQYEAAWAKYYTVVYIVLLCFFVPGLVLSLRDWRSYLLLYLLFAFYTLVIVAFHIQTRYRWEIEPYLIAFAAITIFELVRVVRARLAPKTAPAL